ncbi:unspecified product [Leishmania tarentolae]|uniref:Unspecified product n=1 Tax=Leishmania tarentolae TaxID=5689 RepID=A0A640KW95_LEITA|nr:unspecified product [Leishmania tarentolae]
MDAATLLRCIGDVEKVSRQSVDEAACELKAAVLLFNKQVRLLGGSELWLIPTDTGHDEDQAFLETPEQCFLALTEDEVAAMDPEQVSRYVPRLCECLRTDECVTAAARLHDVVKWHGAELLHAQDLRLTWRRIRASLENMMECGAAANEQRVCSILQMIDTLIR